MQHKLAQPPLKRRGEKEKERKKERKSVYVCVCMYVCVCVCVCMREGRRRKRKKKEKKEKRKREGGRKEDNICIFVYLCKKDIWRISGKGQGGVKRPR